MSNHYFLRNNEAGFADSSFVKIMSIISAASGVMALTSAFFGRDSEPYAISLIVLAGIMAFSLVLCYFKAVNFVRYFLPISTTIWIIYSCLAFGTNLGNQNYLIIALICLAIFGKSTRYKIISMLIILVVAVIINLHQQFYLPYFPLPKAAPVFYLINTVIPLIGISFIYIVVFNNAKRSEKIIQDQKLALENSIMFKNRMLTVIGHDMRTPFVDAKGILELMANNELTENEKKSLTADLQKSVDLSLETIDNILAWATQTYYADNSESKIKPEQIDLHQVVEKIKLFFNQAALKKNIVFKNNISPSTGIIADLEQISFVIRNLTANAVKFSHSNQTIIFSATEGEDKLTFLVRDEGVGMSHDALRSLFDMNRRTTMRGTANEKGSGLGLVFSKELIANHHGELWIESTLGKGTTVCFSLPKLN